MMLLLIEQFFGREIAEQCAQQIGVDRTKGAMQIYAWRQHNDALIHKLQDWLETYPHAQLSVPALADRVFLSERQMKRRFKAATGQSPIQYIQKVKLAEAKLLLEKSQIAISEIGHQVGYEDERYFRELFKKANGLTPSEYRKRFARLSHSKN